MVWRDDVPLHEGWQMWVAAFFFGQILLDHLTGPQRLAGNASLRSIIPSISQEIVKIRLV
jgi:hypothetical protein